MNPYDELTLGQLLAHFRARAGVTGQQIAQALPAPWTRSTWRVSWLENDKDIRPPVDLLEAYFDQCRLRPKSLLARHDVTYLLRAADVEPSDHARTEAIRRARGRLDTSACPGVLLDYRYQLCYWNTPFARWYAGDDAGDTALPSLGQTGKTPQANGAPWQKGIDRLPSLLQHYPPDASGYLALTPGMPLFLLLFSHHSRLASAWRERQPDTWDRLTSFLVVRFWRTILPLMHPAWYPEGYGEPPWLTELFAQLGDLAAPDGPAFIHLLTRLRRMVEAGRQSGATAAGAESAPGLSDARLDLIDDALADDLLQLAPEGAGGELVTITGHPDARFLYLVVLPAAPPRKREHQHSA